MKYYQIRVIEAPDLDRAVDKAWAEDFVETDSLDERVFTIKQLKSELKNL